MTVLPLFDDEVGRKWREEEERPPRKVRVRVFR